MRRIVCQADQWPHRCAAALPTEEELSGLQNEFDQWWAGSPLSKERHPGDNGDNWLYHPDKPVTSWKNIEDFLKENHPGAASGSNFGIEDADPVVRGNHPLDDKRTLADMLQLHNRGQDRYFPKYDVQALYNSPGVAEAIVKGRNKMQQDYDSKPHQLQFNYAQRQVR